MMIINQYDKKIIGFEEYHDNGQLWYRGYYINGNPHGFWESYFSDGQLCYKGNYINDNEHGYWIENKIKIFYLR